MSPVLSVNSYEGQPTFFFGEVVESMTIGIFQDSTSEAHPTVDLFYREAALPLMVDLVEAMKAEGSIPHVFIDRQDDSYRVAVVFLLDFCSKEFVSKFIQNQKEREASQNIIPSSGRLLLVAEGEGVPIDAVESFFDLLNKRKYFRLAFSRPFGAMVVSP